MREILDALCESDARYVWSSDSLSINVYPKASVGNATYLPNHELERISLNNITDPDQALTPLSKLMPNEQVGYMGFGDIQYERPWTVTFEHITVRRMINRLAEHLGPQSLWIWQGSRSERMFTFLKWGPASRSD